MLDKFLRGLTEKNTSRLIELLAVCSVIILCSVNLENVGILIFVPLALLILEIVSYLLKLKSYNWAVKKL